MRLCLARNRNLLADAAGLEGARSDNSLDRGGEEAKGLWAGPEPGLTELAELAELAELPELPDKLPDDLPELAELAELAGSELVNSVLTDLEPTSPELTRSELAGSGSAIVFVLSSS